MSSQSAESIRNHLISIVALGILLAQDSHGQNLLPNTSFEEGGNEPAGWVLQAGQGQWEQTGHESLHSVSVSSINAFWRTTDTVQVQPGQTYVVSYWGKGSSSKPYGVYAQLENVGYRPMVPVEHWAPYAYTAVIPSGVNASYVRVGQGSLLGTFQFDEVELKRVWPVHERQDGHALGVGESTQGNRYHFQTRLQDYRFSNYSRSLHEHTPTFGGYYWEGYWEMNVDQFVTYRHELGGLNFTNATLKATVTYYFSGTLFLEASTDGVNWLEADQLQPSGSGKTVIETSLPAGLLPASEVYVRFRSTGRMNVSNYEFLGEVAEPLPQGEGSTWFVAQEAPSEGAEPRAMTRTAAGHRLTLALFNPEAAVRTLNIACTAKGPAGTRQTQQAAVLPPLSTNEVEVLLHTAGSGENAVRVQVLNQGMTVFDGTVRVDVAAIQDDSFGYQLPASPDCSIWWCEAAYKVGRERSLPTTTNTAVQISAARNEYEPFQIVLRPQSSLSNLTVSVSNFDSSQSAATIASTNVEAFLGAYVPVKTPTDYSGVAGDHPDPLIPLTGPVDLTTGVNQPFWFTVFVPKDTPPGEYEATVTFQSDDLLSTVPVRLQVYGFGLSDVTHTRSAYSVRVDPNWHKPANLDQEKLVWDLYMDNFRRHRVTPYAAHLYAPINWSFANGQATHDFTLFDEIMTRYLDEFNFSGFNVMGVKSPTFPHRLEGHERFTPEYNQYLRLLLQPITAHLREKGWMEKAYCYWTDEPQVSTYPFVLAGMQAIQQVAPDLRRLLTVNADISLHGAVDIWSPFAMTYGYLPTLEQLQQRQAAGEETWWYVAISPKAPEPNNFIDHPAIDHRIRAWLAQRYGVTGDLYWDTTEYTGKDGIERNPWLETLSVSPGGIILGNGDGMLLYPPVKTLPAGPVLSGPINSLRWELIREAMEDGEYFWLLNTMITNGTMRLGPQHPSVMEAHAARQAALDLAPSAKWFHRDPRQLYAARQRLAHAIEALDDGAPWIVRQPASQAIATGGSVVLRAEALGWPRPEYQWQFNGTNLPGATESSLTLSNFNLLQSGAYRVQAKNSKGQTHSADARVEAYASDTPRIVSQPQDLVRQVGATAIFSVTAVSAHPISYSWQLDNQAITSAINTNATLLLTNLNLNQAGDYTVLLTTPEGSATSSVARLTLLAPPTAGIPLVRTGALWRYYDLGIDVGASWREVDFDDTAWKTGAAELGFGDGNEDTLLPAATEAGGPITTVYFRHAFQVSGETLFSSLQGRVLRDDGVVAYLNGVEIFRDNMPAGEPVYSTSALVHVEGEQESQFLSFPVPEHLLQPGTNVLAVEIHQCTTMASNSTPTAYWTFNEAESPWRDSVGTNHFSSSSNNIISSIGRLNGCVANDASANGYLEAADSPELSYSGPFTVGGWFAWGPGADAPVTCLGKAGEFQLYYTGFVTNRYRFEINGTTVQDQTSATTAGQWRFVVGWYDGTNAHIQVDNGPVYSKLVTAPANTDHPLVALETGLRLLAADEVFFYNRVLLPSERASLFALNDPLAGDTDLSFDFGLADLAGQFPQFLSPSSNLVRTVGFSVAFNPDVVSATPMTFQWSFNDVVLPGETNKLLFLESLQIAQTGRYTLKASNSAGVATNSIALTVLAPPPSLTGQWSTVEGGFLLQIPAYHRFCTVLSSSNLLNWTELATLPPSATTTTLLESSTSNPVRFYRLRLEP